MNEEVKKQMDRFKTLSYEDFKDLAKDKNLSIYEKIGFPDSYRKEKEKFIFEDIIKKFDIKNAENKTFLDIGIGCSDLASMIIEFTKEKNINLIAVDSKEMIELLPKSNHLKTFEGYFPDETSELISKYQEKVDYILCYSIFHYVFYNTCSYRFIDIATSLLKPGGKLLIADLPNINKRKRFFNSEKGIEFHQEFTNTKTLPSISHLTPEPTQIDDGVIFGILQRYRNFGFETYLLPQGIELPMANRREDILIVKN
jgi:SAM-dependent methyltransferase